MSARWTIAAWLVGALLAGGCESSRREDIAYRHGVELLSAGSPRSAIPFLTEAVAERSEASAPCAMLALAYALDLQPELAIRYAAQAGPGQAPDNSTGWALVARGIAEMCRHRPGEAAEWLGKAVAQAPAGSGPKRAATQWLILALMVAGDVKGALHRLEPPDRGGEVTPTAPLWACLAYASQGKTTDAADCLVRAAKGVTGYRPARQWRAIDAGGADPNDIPDAAVAAIRRGDLPAAEKLFLSLQRQRPDAADTQTWLALLAAGQGRPDEAKQALIRGGADGSLQSRGLANHLLSVVCALEGRPRGMIAHMLTGQRLMRRHRLSVPPAPGAETDPVWHSDKMK